jgi:predicted neutral ceramidase superfamily lipid hydrolase
VIRFVSPLLYGAICVAVFVTLVGVASSTAVVRLLEALPGGFYLLENPILSVVLLLLACAITFALPDLTIYKLEGSRSLGLKDHARHCALLYAGIVFLLCVLLVVSDMQPGMLQYDLGLAVCAVAVYGILVDAMVVFSKRRFTRAQPEGAP